MYLSIFWYVFVQIAKCICPNYKCICPNCKCICPKEVLASLCRWSSDETNLLPRVIWHQRNVASFRPALYKHWRAWWQQLGQAEEANLSKKGEFTSWGFRCATTCENCCVELWLWSTKALKSRFYSIFYGVFLGTSTALFVRLLRFFVYYVTCVDCVRCLEFPKY